MGRPPLQTLISLTMFSSIVFLSLFLISASIPASAAAGQTAAATGPLVAHPAYVTDKIPTAQPKGLVPEQIKAVYHLPASGGKGTIALISAYDDPTVENDLNVFNKQNGLTACTSDNGCFEKHSMADGLGPDATWALETSLDTQWAHAIAPQAKILLVEARSDSGSDLLDAVDYAKNRSDVVAVSMGWGMHEFPDETALDDHFTGGNAVFFAAVGSKGEILWPAVSARVVSVGGTSLVFGQNSFVRETAWANGGGGLSRFVKQPEYQSFAVPMPKGQRAVPDVSYAADPASGVAVYLSPNAAGQPGWHQVGGTSVGAVQWAAIRALGDGNLNLHQIYTDAMSNSSAYFRDIVEGKNGDSDIYCMTGTGYDYVTGLGSPITADF